MTNSIYKTRVVAWQAGIRQRCFTREPFVCFLEVHFIIQLLLIAMGTKS